MSEKIKKFKIKTELYTLREIEEKVIENNGSCVSCGRPLLPNSIKCYPHTGGKSINNIDNLQWIYFECQSKKCDYQSSLWKVEKRITFNKIGNINELTIK